MYFIFILYLYSNSNEKSKLQNSLFDMRLKNIVFRLIEVTVAKSKAEADKRISVFFAEHKRNCKETGNERTKAAKKNSSVCLGVMLQASSV